MKEGLTLISVDEALSLVLFSVTLMFKKLKKACILFKAFKKDLNSNTKVKEEDTLNLNMKGKKTRAVL